MIKVDWGNRKLIEDAIRESTSQREVLIKLNLSPKGKSYKTLQKYAELYGLVIPKNNTKNAIFKNKIELSEILVENSTYANSSRLKQRLILENLLENRCAGCKIDDTYNGLPITLQLDHIDGNNKNNKLNNLRILCPNCHSQTENWGRKKRIVETVV